MFRAINIRTAALLALAPKRNHQICKNERVEFVQCLMLAGGWVPHAGWGMVPDAAARWGRLPDIKLG